MYIMILLVNSSQYFYPITSQHEFSNRKTQLCQGIISDVVFFLPTQLQKSLWNFFLWFHTRAPYLWSVHLPDRHSPSPTTCAVDDFQRLRFGNSQSPEKFTGKPKIVSHPTSSQEMLKQKSIFTFTLCTIYPSTRSMACRIVASRGRKNFKTDGRK